MPNNCQHPELCLLSETCIPCAICPTAKEKANDRLALTAGSGSWDVDRTHGRLVKITYHIGCKDAEEYAGKLRKEGWKAWSLEVNGNRVAEVMHLPYTNTAHQKALPCLERINAAVIARMSADEATGEERLELLRASKEASEILGQNA